MKTDEVWNLLDESFIEKIYRYSYQRCNTSHEAEELCSQIILNVVSSIHRQSEISNFYAFVWTIARRVYADYCEQRSQENRMISYENTENFLFLQDNREDRILEEEESAEQLKRILYEITFLSKAYRDVIVMYYMEEYKVKDIADKLGISETTVKQRLFSARKEIRKEVSVMKDTNLTLKPVHLAFMGTGNPVGNDPRIRAERMYSQNLIYLCKDKPKTAKELSEELCVPMPYVEEELEIQENGANGNYGTLRKLPNGRYITNILVVDYKEYQAVNSIYDKYLPQISKALRESICTCRSRIESFPTLSPRREISFTLWTLITDIFQVFNRDVKKIIRDKYFPDVEPAKRPFSTVAIAWREDEELSLDFYGRDGITAEEVGGFHYVFLSNVYGNRMAKHFDCWHNLSQDPLLLLLLRTIGGLSVAELKESEKEVCAKAIACGYIRKCGDVLEPNIVVIEDKEQKHFSDFAVCLQENMEEIKEAVAHDLAPFMRTHIPGHLMNEYENYITSIAGNTVLAKAIEELIKDGLLTEPGVQAPEGMLMVVEK